MDLKRLKLAKECIGIVNQLYDLAEVPTEKRQAINDKADKYLLDQVLHLYGVNQQRELLAFRKWQKDNWKDVYLYSDEFMITEFKKAN